MATVDASNACIPPSHPLKKQGCPVPSTVRGESIVMDGSYKRDGTSQLLAYGCGRLVVIRDLKDKNHLIYRGHNATVTAVRFSPSGAYMASGDAKGKLRVWSYDHEEHLPKLDVTLLTGPIRDIAWDFESKRIVAVGERSDTASDSCKAVQWDTGVSNGQLGQHTRGRAISCDVKPNRPMRAVTGGTDDSRVLFNAGPPFKRVVDGVPKEDAHVKGSVKVRYNPDGTKVVSVGSDKCVFLYDGKTLALLHQAKDVHEGSIYACAWSSDGESILTASADGTCKLLSGQDLTVKKEWKVAAAGDNDRVPIGGMQVGCAFVHGDLPLSCSLNGQITLLNDSTVLTGHNAPIAGMASKSWTTIYTCDTDGIVVEWDLFLAKAVRRVGNGNDDLLYKVHGEAAISAICWSNGKLLTAGWDDTVRAENGFVRLLSSQPNGMDCGTEVTAVLTVQGVVILDKDGNASRPQKFDGFAGLSICVSKDDKTVYVGGDDCKIHIYTIDRSHTSMEKNHVIENGHLKAVHALKLSNDGTMLGSADVRDVCIWKVEDYSPLVSKGRWCFHTQRITCLSWSQNDHILASGGADDSIYLWSPLKKMKRLHYNFCHRGGITGLQFLDVYRLVSVGADSCVNVWDMTNDVAKKFGWALTE